MCMQPCIEQMQITNVVGHQYAVGSSLVDMPHLIHSAADVDKFCNIFQIILTVIGIDKPQLSPIVINQGILATQYLFFLNFKH